MGNCDCQHKKTLLCKLLKVTNRLDIELCTIVNRTDNILGATLTGEEYEELMEIVEEIENYLK